ncbi:hypothetical protein B4U80_14194 [Leptotrombidium deliense]|uniref:Uncharacterized protein n=1 Tax=Leptotrombidium deliense TaxID=299467 RepID=A0A443S0I7_9ACAR|nr:hypothetical protein B4U80_14194 [Leptotrombidium deliense]
MATEIRRELHLAVNWERCVIDAKRIPSLAEYLEYRHYTGGIDFFLNLIEIVRNIFIPDSVLVNVTLQRFSYLTSELNKLNASTYIS